MTTLPAYMKLVDRGPPLQEVLQCIEDGDHWVLAWLRQSYRVAKHVSRDTGIGEDRLRRIEAGDVPTHEELDKLATLWEVPVAAIKRTLPFSVL